MKNLVFIPFAFDPAKQTGANVKKRNALNIYLKNLCVAAFSIKKYNQNLDVAIVCNFKLPDFYAQILLKKNILIIVEPFDSYIFPNEYQWNLAFYKLCALEKVVEKLEYDNYLYLDADIIVQDSLEPIFNELSDHILMYDINHGLTSPDYRRIVQEFQDFGVSSYITHYGGEFFAASYKNAKDFIIECKSIYNKMICNNFITTSGDEFIISLAANNYKNKIKNAGAYIFRFWTGSFYLISTCYKFNPVLILHLPGEKNKSILKIFNRYVKRNKFPRKKQVHRFSHLTHRSLETILKQIAKKILRKN